MPPTAAVEPTRAVTRVTATLSRTSLIPTATPTEVTLTPTATNTRRPTETPRPTATRRPTATTRPPDAVVNSETLNMRSGPGTAYQVVTTLKQGDELTVLGVNADRSWIQVRHSGVTGWVAVDLCQVNRNLATVSVVSVAAPTAAPLQTVPLPPTATPTSAPVVQPSPPPAPCNCSGPDPDCGDFGTHAAAQACFNYCMSQGYGDVFRLDSDGDGNACESLP